VESGLSCAGHSTLKHHEDFTAKVEAEIGVKKEDVFTSFNDPNYPCSSMLRLTAPHTLRMGKKHYEIHRVSDCTIPCCRGVSDSDYLAGLLSDVTWLHFHKSGMMNPARWLLRALLVTFLLACVIASEFGCVATEVGVDVKVIITPPCIFHQQFPI
jgi:hypothetical protein